MASFRRQVLDKCAELGAKLPAALVGAVAGSLKGSGLTIKPLELAGFSAGLFCLGTVLGLIFSFSLVLGLVLGLLCGAVPALGCKAFAGARAGKVARQLEAGGLELAQQVHDGKGLLEVIRAAANKLDSPLAEELQAVVAEHSLGVPLEEALARFAIRVRTVETVRSVDVFLDFLRSGRSPLDPFRQLNFQQPYEIPAVPKPPVPSTFEEAAHRLLLRALDSLEPRELSVRRPAGGMAQLLAERSRLVFPELRLPEPLASKREQLLQAVADEAEGRGPLEALLRLPSVTTVYISSPSDVFAAGLPPEMVDNTPAAAQAPEGYQRARTRFRDLAHYRLMVGRLLAPLGATPGPSTPAVEGALGDGWEVAAQLQEGGVPAVALGRARS